MTDHVPLPEFALVHGSAWLGVLIALAAGATALCVCALFYLRFDG